MSFIEALINYGPQIKGLCHLHTLHGTTCAKIKKNWHQIALLGIILVVCDEKLPFLTRIYVVIVVIAFAEKYVWRSSHELH